MSLTHSEACRDYRLKVSRLFRMHGRWVLQCFAALDERHNDSGVAYLVV